jgi:tRNA(Ile)-lysidine synthase
MIVIRPLIDISKAAILAYLEERHLSYRTDLSNLDPRFLRNWIRSELVPKIQARVGAGFSARLTQQAELLRDEQAYLDGLAERSYDAVKSGKNLRRKPLMGEPKALQRRILRHWIEQTRGHLRGLDFVHVDELLRLVEKGPAQARLPIPGGWEFIREYENLRLERRSRGMKRLCYSYNFEIGTLIEIREARLQLCSQRLSSSEARLPVDLSEAIFDIDCVTAPLMVRNFRHGDRFQPLGMTGHKKIKDLFIENKVPLSIRPTWPLLTMGKEILWIPGYGRSNTALVCQKTVTVVRINAFPIGT